MTEWDDRLDTAAAEWLSPRLDRAIQEVRRLGLQRAAQRWSRRAARAGHDLLLGAGGEVALEWAFRDLLLGRLRQIASTCGPREFGRFADLCGRLISPTLGELVGMHAEAADGNSPDLAEWCPYTVVEFEETAQMTPEQARAWWLREYAHE